METRTFNGPDYLAANARHARKTAEQIAADIMADGWQAGQDTEDTRKVARAVAGIQARAGQCPEHGGRDLAACDHGPAARINRHPLTGWLPPAARRCAECDSSNLTDDTCLHCGATR